jgi:hypothetical protein
MTWRFPLELIDEFRRTFPTLNEQEVQACLEVAAAPFVAAVHEHLMTTGRVAAAMKEEEGDDTSEYRANHYKPSWA